MLMLDDVLTFNFSLHHSNASDLMWESRDAGFLMINLLYQLHIKLLIKSFYQPFLFAG